MTRLRESPTELLLVLTPKAGEDGVFTGLGFSLTLRNPHHKAGDFLCTYGPRDKVSPSSRLQRFLQGIPATIRDDQGTVPFELVKEDSTEGVHVTRDVLGDVVVASEVRALDMHETCEDGAVLRRDHGGIVGAGCSFLPQFRADQAFNISVAWDLGSCPGATRAVCSFGEGPQPVQTTSKGDALLKCAFAVGPLKSFPEAPPQHGAQEDFGGTYWFGELPDNLDAVKGYATKIFPAMSAHFKDNGGSYRAFLRRAPKGLKGTVLLSSSIIDYDENTNNEHDRDLIRVLNQTMVSTWTQLNTEDDGTENTWFDQGLSYLFTVYLPFRFKQRGPDYFRATVNAFLSAYYTNPLVFHSLSELDCSDPSQDWYAISAKTTRAFVYMLKMDSHLRRAAKACGEDVERPIDELVRELCMRRKSGEKTQRRHWMEGIAYWLGPEDAEMHFRGMLEDGGKLNELGDMVSSFGSTYGPQPVEQDRLEFGFDKRSLEEGVVSGVVNGSRAAEAGLRDGDQVVWYSQPEACVFHYDAKFKLTVERVDRRFDIEYGPRSKEKVRCWQVLERLKPASDDSTEVGRDREK